MELIVVWLVFFVLSIKPLVTKCRRLYKVRAKDEATLPMVIIVPVLVHLVFTKWLYIETEGWLHWLLPLLNVMFVVHTVLVLTLVLDNFEVVKARVVNDKASKFLISLVGMSALLYATVYDNNAFFYGLSVYVISLGIVAQLVTWRNLRR
ncbi:hypothetical protein L5163_004596 [Vibrio parahaemolyticus]|nr:hypothetical protein [Vibrio parahaemolyticus]